jgi:hypothetical protein
LQIKRKFPEVWTKATTDPEGKVEYLIASVPNRIQMYAASKNAADYDAVCADLFAFSLKGLRGLIDPETGLEFQLKFENVKVGKKTEKRISDDSIDAIPEKLMWEMIRFMTAQNNPTQEEIDQTGFTSEPSPVNLTATVVAETEKTSGDVATDACTEDSKSETIPSATNPGESPQ